jgi:hypothetical protein
MTDGYARTVARFAYSWGWPLVNTANRHRTISQAPEPMLLGVLPVAPLGRLAMLRDYIDPGETFVTCPNQDVVYGLANVSLDDQPVIVQVPDFGDRFWVYACYDGRTDQFGELGKQYGTEPGFHLLVGPNWEGEVPDAVRTVSRCPTPMANVIPRVFMDDTDEDRAAIQDVINGIEVYPLSEFDGVARVTDWASLPTAPPPPATEDGGETKWVVPEEFFDRLTDVLASVPPLPGEESMYAQFRLLLDVAARDADLMRALVETAVAAETEVIAPFFAWKHNGGPAGNGWNRSTNNAQWGVDYVNRTGTAKSNMFENRPIETQYFYTDDDAAGNPLQGNRNYRVTFTEEPPVRGFWSLTLYNDKHLFHPNDLNRFSLGTKNKNLVRNDDGSLTLYAGPRSPGSEHEANWLPAPDGTFSLYIRAYWGDEAIVDGSWKPPAVEPV